MAIEASIRQGDSSSGIKQVPRELAVRAAIRRHAAEIVAGMPTGHAPTRDVLERHGMAVLEALALPERFLGFAMVAISNAFWRDHYAAVPYARRLFLLPHCLRDQAACAATYDTIGLHCAGCGSCAIQDLQGRAEALGYQVIVAEGTSSVIMKVLEGEADAIIGVACLDSLEKSFTRIVDLGIPHVAVPLLSDGCTDTEADTEEVLALLHLQSARPAAPVQSYLPLLRETVRSFEEEVLAGLLAPYVDAEALRGNARQPGLATDAIAVEWLRHGGKRLRPFVTVAAYAVGKYGVAALASNAAVAEMLPDAVRRVALSIEVMHKASLVHDDIEDNDAFRYGQPTLHREHGLGPAINIGDHLVGLGYRLVAGEVEALGASCVADVLNSLSAAHLELCRGQGAELFWKRQTDALRPVDVLSIYALKTAPAFEVALYSGLRAAEAPLDAGLLRRYATYLGEAYQVLNDLDDWRRDDSNKRTLGRDLLAGRPTILWAFALEAGGRDALARLVRDGADPEQVVAKARALYSDLGAFDKAERLFEKLRARTLEVASSVDAEPVRQLLEFLARIVLQQTASPHGA